jgi:hypothetical protein
LVVEVLGELKTVPEQTPEPVVLHCQYLQLAAALGVTSLILLMVKLVALAVVVQTEIPLELEGQGHQVKVIRVVT